MPHFITIIKYEFIIVKYILAFYYTIVDRDGIVFPKRGLPKRTHTMANPN